MNNFVIWLIGSLMGIPPWGSLFGNKGIIVQAVGVVILLVYLGLVIFKITL